MFELCNSEPSLPRAVEHASGGGQGNELSPFQLFFFRIPQFVCGARLSMMHRKYTSIPSDLLGRLRCGGTLKQISTLKIVPVKCVGQPPSLFIFRGMQPWLRFGATVFD